MAKKKTSFICQKCSFKAIQWTGQCQSCHAFNTMVEAPAAQLVQSSHYAAASDGKITSFDEIDIQELERFNSGNVELDRVLGGGFVPGSVLVLSGDPGVGKSTLTLQICAHLAMR